MIEPELPADTAGVETDAHSLNPVKVLRLVSVLGWKVPRMVVVGCEPFTVEPDEQGNWGLSEPARAAVPEAIRAIEGIISAHGRIAMAA